MRVSDWGCVLSSVAPRRLASPTDDVPFYSAQQLGACHWPGARKASLSSGNPLAHGRRRLAARNLGYKPGATSEQALMSGAGQGRGHVGVRSPRESGSGTWARAGGTRGRGKAPLLVGPGLHLLNHAPALTWSCYMCTVLRCTVAAHCGASDCAVDDSCDVLHRSQPERRQTRTDTCQKLWAEVRPLTPLPAFFV